MNNKQSSYPTCRVRVRIDSVNVINELVEPEIARRLARAIKKLAAKHHMTMRSAIAAVAILIENELQQGGC